MSPVYLQTRGVHALHNDARLELADLVWAPWEAIRFAGEVIRDMGAAICARPYFQVDVRNAARRSAITLNLSAGSRDKPAGRGVIAQGGAA